MSDKIRWGILGPGKIAITFARCLRELPDAEIAAVGSRSYERSKSFCEQFGGTPYGSYKEMVEDPNVDIVYVATPHHLHEEHAILAANAGKAILCEKPFAVNEKQTRSMFAAAKANNVFIMEGLWSRFFPAWEFVVDLMKKNKLGELIEIQSSTSWGALPSTLDPGDRLLDINTAGGSLLDAGIYSLASTTLIMGDEKPSEIYSITKIGKTGVDEHDAILLNYNSGPYAKISCGIMGYLHETNIICEYGTITVPRHRNPDRVLVRDSQTGERWSRGSIVEYHFPYNDEGFQFEAKAVQECYRQGLKECPQVKYNETIVLMQICDQIRKNAGLVYPFEKL